MDGGLWDMGLPRQQPLPINHIARASRTPGRARWGQKRGRVSSGSLRRWVEGRGGDGGREEGGRGPCECGEGGGGSAVLGQGKCVPAEEQQATGGGREEQDAGVGQERGAGGQERGARV